MHLWNEYINTHDTIFSYRSDDNDEIEIDVNE